MLGGQADTWLLTRTSVLRRTNHGAMRKGWMTVQECFAIDVGVIEVQIEFEV